MLYEDSLFLLFFVAKIPAGLDKLLIISLYLQTACLWNVMQLLKKHKGDCIPEGTQDSTEKRGVLKNGSLRRKSMDISHRASDNYGIHC